MSTAQSIRGRDGHLFLGNDTNRVLDQIEGRLAFDGNVRLQLASVHQARAQLVGWWGGRYHHCVIPNKEVALRDRLPDTVQFEKFGKRPIEQYLASSASRIWKPFYEPDLLTDLDGETFFPKQDTHWTFSGAIRYFQAFLRAANVNLAALCAQVPLREFDSSQVGDLGTKLGLPAEPIRIKTPKAPQGRMIFTNKAGNEGCVRLYHNPALRTERRAIVLHDSFTMWLFDLIGELFSDTFFIHTADFDFAAVEHLKPDFVFFIQIERFFPRVPQNGLSWVEHVRTVEHSKAAHERFDTFLGALPPEANWLARMRDGQN